MNTSMISNKHLTIPKTSEEAHMSTSTARIHPELIHPAWIHFTNIVEEHRKKPVGFHRVYDALSQLSYRNNGTASSVLGLRSNSVCVHPCSILPSTDLKLADNEGVRISLFNHQGELSLRIKRPYEFFEVDDTIGATFGYNRRVYLKDLDLDELYDLCTLATSQRIRAHLDSVEQRTFVKTFYLNQLDRQGYTHHLHEKQFKVFDLEEDRLRIFPNGRLNYQSSGYRLMVRLMIDAKLEYSVNAVFSMRRDKDEERKYPMLRYDGPVDSLPSDFITFFHVTSPHLKTYSETGMLSIDTENDFHLWLWWLQSMSQQLDGIDAMERRVVRVTLLQAVNALRRLPNSIDRDFIPSYWRVIDNALELAGYSSDKPEVPEWQPIVSKTEEQRIKMHQTACQMFRYVCKNPSAINVEILYGIINTY